MTTKRTVENRLDDLEPDDDGELGFSDAVEYLKHVKAVEDDDGEHVALSRSVYFGRDATPDQWQEFGPTENRLYEEWPLYRVVTNADYLDPSEKFALPVIWASAFFSAEYSEPAINQWWERLPEHKQERVNRALVPLSDSGGDDS